MAAFRPWGPWESGALSPDEGVDESAMVAHLERTWRGARGKKGLNFEMQLQLSGRQGARHHRLQDRLSELHYFHIGRHLAANWH